MLETELFETLDFNRVIMRCDSDNQASENVMKRLNYNFEGKWRQHKFQPLRNKYVDYLFYSKLKNEYFKG
ncbi:MAG: hypothetical protein BWY78_01514 [Alphaproteobacteria bacterium ADurb.Bin438]|nr:MAG: hypothetical protein BWY78_01514 [Alphaproteobacteria bacterium ADurb.Bin438]